MFLSKMPMLLDMATFLLAILSAISSAIMIWLIYKNECACLLIKRGNGGKHIRAIAVGAFLSSLSSLPYLAFSMDFQNQICPFKWLHILACLRVFSLRLEMSQLLFLSIDRLIISLELNSSKCRLVRRSLFWPFQIAACLLSLAELYMFVRKERSWPSYSLDCTIMSSSTPVFLYWHFFLANFLTLALAISFLLAQHIFQPVQLISSSIRRRMAGLANCWLLTFSLALAIVFALELATRFSANFDANKMLRNYPDTIFQLLHLILLPIFLRAVPWKANAKIHTSSSINTVEAGLVHST